MTCRQTAREADKLIENYLTSLDAALQGVDASRRVDASRGWEILTEVHEHIEEGRDGLDTDDAAGVRALLARVGDPAAIAAEAGAPPPDSRRWDAWAPWLIIFGPVASGPGWIAGILILWTSPIWSRRDKLVATIVPLVGLAAFFYLMRTRRRQHFTLADQRRQPRQPPHQTIPPRWITLPRRPSPTRQSGMRPIAAGCSHARRSPWPLPGSEGALARRHRDRKSHSNRISAASAATAAPVRPAITGTSPGVGRHHSSDETIKRAVFGLRLKRTYMTALIGTQVLGKRHRRLWALADCTPSAPGGRVAGLVGPNGAGKATLLSLAAGLIEPARGMIEVLCGPPPANPPQLARAGFVARDAPVYAGLPVAGHLALGAHLNPRWDEELARGRAGQLDLNPGQKARTLSGGQRARLALTLAIGKRPWAADPRRTSGQPGTAGPAGVPAGPDGGQRRVLIGLTAMAVTEGLSLMFGWWAAPIGQAARLATGNAPIGSPFSPRSFDALGIAPLGYAALAFVLAVTAGLLIQRVVPAMAVTLVRLAPAGPGGASAAASCGGGTRPDCQRKGWR